MSWKIKEFKYGKQMDREMIPLCNALNSMHGVRTVESCGGHGRSGASVFFFCTDIVSLAKIQRAIDYRYGGQLNQWELHASTTDTSDGAPNIIFRIKSRNPYDTKKNKKHDYMLKFYRDTNIIIKNLELYHTRWGDRLCRKGECKDVPKKMWDKWVSEMNVIERDFLRKKK